MSNEPKPEHHVFELDGVSVHHYPSDSTTCDAVLLFGAGQRDESLATLGTLHMLEHLVMYEVRRTPVDINASVDSSLTRFTADGSPTLVRDFLEGVCRGLVDPPVTRLPAEASVLAAEGADDGGSPLGPARYGLRDLGLVGAPGPGPLRITREMVTAAAERWFVAGNALLIIDGPWPDGLVLPLRPGKAPSHQPVPPRRWDRPHAVTVDGPACGFSLILPASDGSGLDLLAGVVIEQRMTEVLRHDRGLTYSLDRELMASADGQWELQIAADPPPERAAEAGLSMIEATTGLLGSGATAEELEHARALVLESGRGREAEIAAEMDVAIGSLLGNDVRPFDPRAIAAITLDESNDYLRRLSSDVLYLIDQRAADEAIRRGVPVTDIPPGSAGPLPTGEVFRPPLIARAINKDARASRVVLTSDGLAQQIGDDVWTLQWSEVAGVLREPIGDLVVLADSGVAITIGPDLYRNGKKLVDAVLTNVSAELIWDDPFPDDPDTDKIAP